MEVADHTCLVYNWCMTRTNIDIDDEACARVMRRFGLSTKREAVNFAIRMLAHNGLTIGETLAAYDAGQETRSGEARRSNTPRYVELQGDVTYRRATIEEARRMRGETDLDAVPTREEWLYRPLVPVKRLTIEEALALRGSGWDGDLEEMRRNSPQLEAWLNRPADERLPGLERELLSPAVDDDSPGGQRAR